MKKLHLTFLFIFLLFNLVNAQYSINGTITDDKGEQLVGVSVVAKGTTNGVTSDLDGKYAISVPEKSTLIFSFVGFQTVELVVSESGEKNVSMPANTKVLGEVIVTGYGSQIKRELTGNISKIRTGDIKDLPVTSFDQAIQGKAAGVQINSGSGKLGQAPQVRVRGQSSVSASNEPLYVIDGIPATQVGNQSAGFNSLSLQGGITSPLADINPQDIESIEILKDASAGAIYGARAANGVVLITTKRGKAGRSNITFGAQFGNSTPTKKVSFLNTAQYIELYKKAAANADRIDNLPASDPDSYTTYMNDFFKNQSLNTFGTAQQTDTDWGSLAYQDAPMKQYDLNISGGSEKTTFYISGQLLDQKGILIGNALTRLNGRINLDHKLSDVLNIGINMGLTRNLNERVSGDRSFDNPMQIVALSPFSPSIDPVTKLPIGSPPGDINYPVYYNPVINIGNSYYNTTTHRNITSVYGQVKITNGLSFRSEFGTDLLDQQEELYSNSKTQRNSGSTAGVGSNRFVRIENYNLNNYFNYKTIIGLSTVDATAGITYQESQTKRSFVEGKDFPSDAYRMIVSAARKTDGNSSQSDFRFLSYFARGNYKFNNRYLLSASARIDGSTRFGKDSRYGFFPSGSLGWILSEESFLKNNSTVSFFKIRASYGRTGNAEIGDFPQLGLFTGDAGYATLPGQRPSQLANPNLSWETTDQMDIGIDFGFVNDRITGEIDYYQKRTSGLLLNVNVPGNTGFTSQVKNVGKLQNDGFEFVLNADNFKGEFKWRTSLNLAINTNKITDLQGQIIEGGLNNMSRAVEGEPLGTYFTAEYAGVDPANGDAIWYKNSKNTDGSIDRTTTNKYNQATRVVVGSPLPKWIGGVSNTFSYKGIELSVFLNGVFGNKLNFYGVGRFSSANARFEDNQTVDQLNAWSETNKNTNIPEPRLFSNNGAQPSSRFIQDGSFVRLRNVTLSYTLPRSVLSSLKLNNARIFVSGLNLATFTNYTGWDPELNADDIVTNIAIGYDFYTAPQPKTIVGGFSFTF
jgi:TonB-dependent starch-binding outer membrane protein SusC